MLEGKIKHTSRPDTTNLVKLYEDVLKGTLIKDDSSVYRMYAHKKYSDRPGVRIRLYTQQDFILPENHYDM